MMRRTIGIVDYGAGNLSSVWRALHRLDYRCRVSSDPEVLNDTDLLLLPGVGAFPAAMAKLHKHGMVDYLQDAARGGRPILGICLGMQLLADTSSEFQTTAGLGLIPGEVKPLGQARWHIGWNNIEVVKNDPIVRASDGCSFYFNHAYIFDAPLEYRLCVSRLRDAFTIGVRRDNLVGLQFHPEKSQGAGRQLLRNVIEGLCRD